VHVLGALVQGCLERGLDWIKGHLDLFVPEDPFDPEKLKQLAELSILYNCLWDWHAACRRPDLGPIKKCLVEFLGDPLIAEWVRKLPSYYSPYVIAYLSLRATGVTLPAFEETVRVLRRAGYPRSLETTPYRELEFLHLAWKGGLARRPPTCGAIYRRTSLARAANPIYLSGQEVYSVTHTIFYVSDMAGAAGALPRSERERAVAVVEPLLVHYWRKPDWDLTSELLLNLVALSRFDTPLFAAALSAVAAAWRADGSLPGPAFAALSPDATRRQIFEGCYHTTLVGLILCGAVLSRW
jgi:hypothetical protein